MRAVLICCTIKCLLAEQQSIARHDDVAVERADAAAWIARQLARRRIGEATVVYHSVVWQYLGADIQQAVQAAMEHAGRSATAEAPLAWLTLEFEAEGQPPTLAVTQWPGGVRRRLARSHPHGAWVEWLPKSADGST